MTEISLIYRRRHRREEGGECKNCCIATSISDDIQISPALGSYIRGRKEKLRYHDSSQEQRRGENFFSLLFPGSSTDCKLILEFAWTSAFGKGFYLSAAANGRESGERTRTKARTNEANQSRQIPSRTSKPMARRITQGRPTRPDKVLSGTRVTAKWKLN